MCVCTNLYGGNLQPTKVVQCVHDDPCLTPKMTMDQWKKVPGLMNHIFFRSGRQGSYALGNVLLGKLVVTLTHTTYRLLQITYTPSW